MRPPMSDPTAGERARSIRAHPGAPHVVVDPTDPNYGMFRVGALGTIHERPYRIRANVGEGGAVPSPLRT